MTIHVRDAEADRLIRELAERHGVSITDAIKLAAQVALSEPQQPSAQRDEALIAAMLERWDRLPRSPETSTKEYSDGIWGDDNK